jgi:hypothetical protein
MKFLSTKFWTTGGWFTWVAVGVAAVGVAGSVASNAAGKQSAPGQAAPVNAQDQQTLAIQGNQAALPAAEQLTSDTNEFNQSQAVSLMNQAMPGYSQLASTLTGQAQSLAANPYSLPAGVQQKLQQQAAEMGVSTGRTGQAGQFSVLQDLGINELQYGQAQLGEASSLTGLLASIAPKVNPMSPISMMISPAQQLQVATGNQSAQQAALNATTAASNANATANAGMWGNITGSIIGGISGASMNGMSTPTATSGPLTQGPALSSYGPNSAGLGLYMSGAGAPITQM